MQTSQNIARGHFFKNSPLHDGATIIEGHLITAAGAVIPLSENGELPSLDSDTELQQASQNVRMR